MNKRTCTMPECNRAHRARGLCGSHYNQTHAIDRHAKKLTPCAWCGTEVLKQSGGGRKYGQVCSDQCRAWLQRPYSALPANHWALWYGKTSAWTAPQPKARVQPKDVDCIRCGVTFHTHQPMRTYCSSSCKRADAGRYARGKWITKARRERLHTRDAWTCWMCGLTCDPTLDPSKDNLYPTLDHLTPRSHGGRDDDDNLKTACRGCNVQRGNTLITSD